MESEPEGSIPRTVGPDLGNPDCETAPPPSRPAPAESLPASFLSAPHRPILAGFPADSPLLALTRARSHASTHSSHSLPQPSCGRSKPRWPTPDSRAPCASWSGETATRFRTHPGKSSEVSLPAHTLTRPTCPLVPGPHPSSSPLLPGIFSVTPLLLPHATSLSLSSLPRYKDATLNRLRHLCLHAI